MRYFMLKLDSQFTHAPDIKNWYGKVDTRYINKENSDRLPSRELIELIPSERTIFTDIISFPFLLVSQEFKDLIEIYEPLVTFKDIVLLDKVNKNYALYYLPILDNVECLHESSIFNLNHSVIKKAVLDVAKTEDKSIFCIDLIENTYIVIRLDLAESILRRNMVGIGLEPIECWLQEDER